ncbi:MAG: M48 family metallopeptidase [bacterium]
MWEAIRSNRRRSTVFIMLMGVVLVILGFAVGMTLDPEMGGGIGALGAVGLWFILCLTALMGGDRILLMSSNAHQIQKKDAPQLWNTVEEMTIASGLGSMPKVYIIDDHVPNAFAVGQKPEKAAVAVTSGLLKRLDRDELQGVIAHELGHIKNLDVRFMTIASVMMGSIILISEVFLRSLFYGRGRRSSRSSRSGGGGQAQAIIMVVALILAILAPILARLLYFACSRRREYLADASAARFTRYPEGLASALEKISSRASGAKKVSRALAPLYIVNPLQSRSAISLFSTHPPTERRIQILRSMAGGAGYLEYENAYRKICGEKKRCIGDETLQPEKGILARAATPETETKKDAIGRAQEIGDLLDRLVHFLIIPCACGMRIKIPPEFKRKQIPCPRCGRKHALSDAKKMAEPEAPPESGPIVYQRKGTGWESVVCSCGKVAQLSPTFEGDRLTCSGCGREVKVLPAQEPLQ